MEASRPTQFGFDFGVQAHQLFVGLLCLDAPSSGVAPFLSVSIWSFFSASSLSLASASARASQRLAKVRHGHGGNIVERDARDRAAIVQLGDLVVVENQKLDEFRLVTGGLDQMRRRRRI